MKIDFFMFTLSVMHFIILIVDYYIMKPLNKNLGVGYRVFSFLMGIAGITLAFL